MRRRARRSAQPLDVMSGTKYTCPSCGYATLGESPGSFDICKICFWEDDPVQLLDPWYVGGANKVSLVQAQENYRSHGVSELRFKEHVRAPLPTEVRDEKWRAAVEADRARATTPARLSHDLPEGEWPWYYWAT